MTPEEKVKNKVLDLGADFVGISSPSRYDGAPDFSDPKNLLPNYQSVIVFGIAMNRGALEAWFSKKSRRPLILQDKLATSELDRMSLYLSRLLERDGHKSLFISQNGQYNAMRGRPDFSHKHAAMAAGLGRLGLSSNFVHKAYGAAVHIASVITEAKLMPDPMLTDEENPCHECKSCLQICPEQSMHPEKKSYFYMEGKEYSHQKLNGLGCAWGCAGLSGHRYKIGNREVGTWSYNDIRRPEDPGEFYTRFLKADKNERHPKEQAEMILCGGTEYCGNCVKICIGSKKATTALFKTHLNAGLAPIPEDPTLILNVTSANAKLEKFSVPKEEIEALIKGTRIKEEKIQTLS